MLVTHPEVTRYFMTIQEAAQLVIQAGAYTKGGGIFGRRGYIIHACAFDFRAFRGRNVAVPLAIAGFVATSPTNI